MVGAGRSGTTLLAAMLAAHPEIDCGPETNFFARLARRPDPAAVLGPPWPRHAVDYIAELTQIDLPVTEQFGLTLAEVERFLAAREPSLAAMLESLTVQHAAQVGKPRWAEKTPLHLLHLPAIRAAFPGACVIRMVRDPRDVALSLRKLRMFSRSAMANLYTWVDWDERSHDWFTRDERSLTVRYEMLTAEPERVMREVCAFIGAPFDERMLRTEESARRVVAQGVSWNERVGQPIDQSRVGVWQHEMDAGTAAVAALVAREGLERYGYDGAVDGTTVRFVPLTRPFVEANEPVLVDLARNGVRLSGDLAELPGHGSARAVYWGMPGEMPWVLGKGRWQRTRAAALHCARLVTSRMRGRAAIWVAEPTGLPMARASRFLDRVCDAFLRAFARRVGPASLARAAGGHGRDAATSAQRRPNDAVPTSASDTIR